MMITFPELDKAGVTRLVDEMKAFAKSAVITDYDAYARAARMSEEGIVKTEVQAGLIMTRGGKLPQAVEPYTRFFALDGVKLQLMYLEIQLPNQYIRQFTLVNPWKIHLDLHQAGMLLEQFIDPSMPVRIVKTPPHVMFLLQEGSAND